MVIRWTDTFQRWVHADWTSTFTLRLVYKVDFFTSNRCRFYVEKYLCERCIFINVDLTSIQRWNFPIHKDYRFINVEYTPISRRCFPHGIRRFFDLECTSIQSRNFPIHEACWFIIVDSTSRFPHGISRFFDVECTSIQPWYFPINKTCCFFNVEYTVIPCRCFPTVAKGTSSGTFRSTMSPLAL